MSYTHLSREKRKQLAALIHGGWSQSAVARELGVHRSTISRELKRNGDSGGGYHAKDAAQKSELRRKKARAAANKLGRDRRTRDYVIRRLKEHWSPQRIAQDLRAREGLRAVSHETIYRFIDEQRPDLKKYLRSQRSTHQKKADVDCPPV
jgi:IS30 family transposase